MGDDAEMSSYRHSPYHTLGFPEIKLSFLANRPQHRPSLHQRNERTRHLAQRLLGSLPPRSGDVICRG